LSIVGLPLEVGRREENKEQEWACVGEGKVMVSREREREIVGRRNRSWENGWMDSSSNLWLLYRLGSFSMVERIG
jgi:hypothetical protein